MPDFSRGKATGEAYPSGTHLKNYIYEMHNDASPCVRACVLFLCASARTHLECQIAASRHFDVVRPLHPSPIPHVPDLCVCDTTYAVAHVVEFSKLGGVSTVSGRKGLRCSSVMFHEWVQIGQPGA